VLGLHGSDGLLVVLLGCIHLVLQGLYLRASAS